MTRTFPSGFLWGVTTGAHQTEGNNLASDWWAQENAPDTTINEPSGDAVAVDRVSFRRTLKPSLAGLGGQRL